MTPGEQKVIRAAKAWLAARKRIESLKGPVIIEVMARGEFDLVQALAILAEEESPSSTDDEPT